MCTLTVHRAGVVTVGLLLAATSPVLALDGSILINEVLAANESVIADEAGEFDDYVELVNAGTVAVDLGGLFLSDDIANPQKWEIPTVVLGPLEVLLVWADEDGSQGPFHANFKLDAQGEVVMLFDRVADGNGLLDRVAFGVQMQDVSWGRLGGSIYDRPEYLVPATPHAGNDASTRASDICINEFLTTSTGGGVDDWIELYNRSASTIDLSGWGLTDDVTLPLRYTFPVGTTVGPLEHLFISEDDLGFSLSSAGEMIMLTEADGVTGRDFVEFGAQVADVSFGRYLDGESRWNTFSPPTPNAANMNATVAVEPTSVAPFFSVAAGENPSRSVVVWITLDRAAPVRAHVVDVQGRVVHRFPVRDVPAGRHELRWTGGVAPGRYWVRVVADGIEQTLAITRTR